MPVKVYLNFVTDDCSGRLGERTPVSPRAARAAQTRVARFSLQIEPVRDQHRSGRVAPSACQAGAALLGLRRRGEQTTAK